MIRQAAQGQVLHNDDTSRHTTRVEGGLEEAP